MRVTQALSQSLLQRLKRRAPVVTGMICVAFAVGGCASTNKLGAADSKEESTVVASQGAQVRTISQLQKFMWFFSPYRPSIQQGNFISEEMVQQLKVGMTRDQVRFVLGTPLMMDIFHADRWDYPFRLARGNGEVIESAVVVYFKNGTVERFEGGNLPTEKEYIALIANPAKSAKEVLREQRTALPASGAPLPAGTDSSPAQPVDVTPKIEKK
ncbi:outer membrane protein assembly factor BamE [Duganella sp. FT92W]|uniref:Outer membrane protein assembly factor BamE n=1 Tax=Pseudoduganella rivuli TaxID=2666085 RepID=A0A7X2ISS8_9BURK|nr:outer membrane protein assembly factor BamE [Pseudoduganella rivuli]